MLQTLINQIDSAIATHGTLPVVLIGGIFLFIVMKVLSARRRRVARQKNRDNRTAFGGSLTEPVESTQGSRDPNDKLFGEAFGDDLGDAAHSDDGGGDGGD